MRYRVSVSEALQLVLADVSGVSAEHVPLPQALGRTLRTAICSADDLPPFDNSAMDGFAVRSADCATLPVMLRIADTVTAGRMPGVPVTEGACAAIMTGAPLPAGADTVVPVEWTELVEPGLVRIRRAPAKGVYVRRAGQEARRGDTMLEAGLVISPQILGMAAGAGMHEVAVSRIPKVGVISTGDEVYAGRGPLPEGKIRDINGIALAALVTAAGGEPVGPRYARDDAGSVARIIELLLAQSNLLLISGGVSVGQHDLVRTVLKDMGLDMLLWRVRQRPGGPLAFGRLGGRAVFGLPGNPVSSAVCFDQYVRPFLAAMLRRMQVHRPRLWATLSAPTPKKKGLHVFARGIYRSNAQGQLVVRDTGPQASSRYSSMTRANCIIHLEEEVEAAPAGMRVAIEPLL